MGTVLAVVGGDDGFEGDFLLVGLFLVVGLFLR